MSTPKTPKSPEGGGSPKPPSASASVMAQVQKSQRNSFKKKTRPSRISDQQYVPKIENSLAADVGSVKSFNTQQNQNSEKNSKDSPLQKKASLKSQAKDVDRQDSITKSQKSNNAAATQIQNQATNKSQSQPSQNPPSNNNPVQSDQISKKEERKQEQSPDGNTQDQLSPEEIMNRELDAIKKREDEAKQKKEMEEELKEFQKKREEIEKKKKQEEEEKSKKELKQLQEKYEREVEEYNKKHGIVKEENKENTIADNATTPPPVNQNPYQMSGGYPGYGGMPGMGMGMGMSPMMGRPGMPPMMNGGMSFSGQPPVGGPLGVSPSQSPPPGQPPGQHNRFDSSATYMQFPGAAGMPGGSPNPMMMTGGPPGGMMMPGGFFPGGNFMEDQMRQKYELDMKLMMEDINTQWEQKMAREKQKLYIQFGFMVPQKSPTQLQQEKTKLEQEMAQLNPNGNLTDDEKRRFEDLLNKKNQVDAQVLEVQREAFGQMLNIDRDWELIDYMNNERDRDKEVAEQEILKEKIRHFNEVQQYQYSETKKKNSSQCNQKLEVVLKKDIEILKQNLLDKLNQLIDKGFDLDDVFNGVKDDEEVKWNFSQQVDIPKSCICNKMKLSINVGIQIPTRRRNMEIQTYKVGFSTRHSEIDEEEIEQSSIPKALNIPRAQKSNGFGMDTSLDGPNSLNKSPMRVEFTGIPSNRTQNPKYSKGYGNNIQQNYNNNYKSKSRNDAFSQVGAESSKPKFSTVGSQPGVGSIPFNQSLYPQTKPTLNDPFMTIQRASQYQGFMGLNNQNFLPQIKANQVSFQGDALMGRRNTIGLGPGAPMNYQNNSNQSYDQLNTGAAPQSRSFIGNLSKPNYSRIPQKQVIKRRSPPPQQQMSSDEDNTQQYFDEGDNYDSGGQEQLPIQPEGPIGPEDLQFLVGILRKNQRDEMLKAIREEEKKEKVREKKLSRTQSEYEKRGLKQQHGIERATAKSKLDRIQKKYEDQYMNLVERTAKELPPDQQDDTQNAIQNNMRFFRPGNDGINIDEQAQGGGYYYQ